MRGTLASLIAAVVSGEASEAIGRARRAAIIYVIVGLCLLCGAGFLVGAGFIALSRETGTLAAALWFAGGFITLALILLLIQRIGAGARARSASVRRSSEMRTVASAAAFAILPGLLASRGRAVALLAPAVAVLAYAVYRENADSARAARNRLPRK